MQVKDILRRLRTKPMPDGLTPHVRRDRFGDERLEFKWQGKPISFMEGLAFILLCGYPATPNEPWESPEDLHQMVNVFGIVSNLDWCRLNEATIRALVYPRRLRRALMKLPCYNGLLSEEAWQAERMERSLKRSCNECLDDELGIGDDYRLL